MISIDKATRTDVLLAIGRSEYRSEPVAEKTIWEWMMRSTYCWVGRIDEQVACVWGIELPTILSERGYLWLFTTDLVLERPFVFVRHSQMVIDNLLEHYPVLIGHAEAQRQGTMKWLTWLGASFDRSRGPLVPFQIVRKHG